MVFPSWMDKDFLVPEIARINALTPDEARAFIRLVGCNPSLVDGNKVVVRSPKGQMLSRITWPVDPDEPEADLLT